ncbi:MAG: hypothetical protein K6E40_03095, partial [Desulfovibrio sp.]|nr:hypothetical protein [Desulfovibrio sp.]
MRGGRFGWGGAGACGFAFRACGVEGMRAGLSSLPLFRGAAGRKPWFGFGHAQIRAVEVDVEAARR